jgi:transcriptional regulator with XRE-family HTH domain
VPTAPILRNLGAEVRERRKAKNLSQEELAGRAGIHTNVVGRLERGIYNPTVLILLAIATKLNTTVTDLFVGADRR